MKKIASFLLLSALFVVSSCSSPAEMTEGNNSAADSAATQQAQSDSAMNMLEKATDPGAPDSAKGH